VIYDKLFILTKEIDRVTYLKSEQNWKIVLLKLEIKWLSERSFCIYKKKMGRSKYQTKILE
jgi:hypothetical protein